MAGVSKLKREYGHLVDMVTGMFRDHCTITEVHDALQELGADVSRSTVGRYRLSWLESMVKLEEAREFAQHIVGGLTDNPENRTGRALVTLLEGATFQAVMAISEAYRENPEKALEHIATAAKAASQLSRAAKDDAERTIKVSEFADEQAARAAEIIDADAGPQTLQIELIAPKQLEAAPVKKAGKKSAVKKPAAKKTTAKKPTAKRAVSKTKEPSKSKTNKAK